MHANSSTFWIDVLIVGNLKNSFDNFHYNCTVDLISICSYCRLNILADLEDNFLFHFVQVLAQITGNNRLATLMDPPLQLESGCHLNLGKGKVFMIIAVADLRGAHPAHVPLPPTAQNFLNFM